MGQEFSSLVTQLTQVRETKKSIARQLYSDQEKVKLFQYKLQSAGPNNLDTKNFEENISKYQQSVNDLQVQWNGVLVAEGQIFDQLTERNSVPFDSLVENLDDRVPVLFFPVRIETTFQDVNGHELWVRIFPDDIAVDTHEDALTENEVAEGQQYWESVGAATEEVQKVQAWDLLCRSYGNERAAWVALQMMPGNPSPAMKADSWSKQPEIKILPDAFVVYAYGKDGSVISQQTAYLPDNIKIGLDPNNENTFDQSNGELTADASVEWMIDFDAAITNGLGLKMALTDSQYAHGFRRILVLGVKASLTSEASQERLEELINNHHYTDGFSFLKQGTNINNTDTDYSGYSVKDLGNNTTNDTERKDNLYDPVTVQMNKPDGQWFCEALGIEYDPTYHIYHSNGYDIRDAMYMNTVLWPATWGYYTSSMLHPLVSRNTSRDLRSFFTSYVRSRGALPSIRSGVQPYGILPASVTARMDWTNDPGAGLHGNIRDIIGGLHPIWNSALDVQLATTANAGFPAGQQLMNIFSSNPLSTEYVQRVGVGAGYIWNNLTYAEGTKAYKGLKSNWFNTQQQRIQDLEDETGFKLPDTPKILQTNFIEDQANVTIPLVAGNDIPQNGPLPNIGSSNYNYLSLAGAANFYALRDEKYGDYGVDDKDIPQTMLYRLVRQSMLLEYYDVACDVLDMNDEDRVEPEFINMGKDAKEQPNHFRLYTGDSRWQVMETPFGGYTTVAEYIDSGALQGDVKLVNLEQMRLSLGQLATNTIHELHILTAGVLDTTSFRLDVWRLSLVNQRLNTLRGIHNGSTSRNMGIYLGAYGWVEDIERKDRSYVPPPTANFSGDIAFDSTNQGFIHAPSINQAITGAVLRAGYVNRAESSNTSPLSVNLSSERVRGALDILEGIRNGQQLGVLLGYELERRLHENYNNMDQYIEPLRKAFSQNNTIVEVTPDTIDKIKARNVVNGVAIVERYKSYGMTGTNGILSYAGIPSAVSASLETEIKWIWNLMDATGDITMSEGMFHIVQGNPVKAGAITDAISKGNLVAEPDILNTPKTGISVNQHFSMHFPATGTEVWTGIAQTVRSQQEATAQFPHWQTIRAQAEPYLNAWVASLLGEPVNICGKIFNTNTETDFSLSDLGIQALDFIYMAGEELRDDDSMLSLIVKKYFRKEYSIPNDTVLTIDYSNNSTPGAFSFTDILPIAKYAKRIITGCRHLNTLDYIAPTEADGAVKQYNLSDLYTRVNTVYAQLTYDRDALVSKYDNGNATDAQGLRDKLQILSRYGIEQTVYEFNDNDAADLETLKAWAQSVIDVSGKRLKEADAISFDDPLVVIPGDNGLFVQNGLDRLKALLGRDFSALPLFTIRTAEAGILDQTYNNATGYNTLLNDHPNYACLPDEWAGSIAKVRKNAANYEMLAVLAARVNMDNFITYRELKPFQLPYDTSPGSNERWLGASVTANGALKEGRTSFGISTPAGHDFTTDNQVGIMIDEWIDVIPNEQETSGIAFHHDQPNAKAPQCLILGLTPQITGNWQWQDMVDMLNETFDTAKQRSVDYETLSNTSHIAQLATATVFPFSGLNSTIGLTAETVANL